MTLPENDASLYGPSVVEHEVYATASPNTPPEEMVHELKTSLPDMDTHMAVAKQGLSWNDTYYDGQSGIVAVFDSHERRNVRVASGILLLVGIICITIAIAIQDDYVTMDMSIRGAIFVLVGSLQYTFADSMVLHVAVTNEGLRVDSKSGCRSMAVSFEEIGSCEQRSCCCTSVIYVKLSRPRGCRRWIKLTAMAQPQEFIDLVMSMKNASPSTTSLNPGTVEVV